MVHDRLATQHYTDQELLELEEYMKTHFPEDIPNSYISILHQHSDNAGQHFKNTGHINYFTGLVKNRGGGAKTAYVYSFGAPSHGKGPYNGVGA